MIDSMIPARGMKRLTEKFRDGYSYSIKRRDMNIHGDRLIGEFPDKLGQIEDFEEKLDVCCSVFISALTDSYYVKIKYPSGLIRREKRYGRETTVGKIDDDWVLFYGEIYYVKLKDYGKTWALTKEELE